MQLSGIRSEDIVRVDVRGTVFHGEVQANRDGKLEIVPLQRGHGPVRLVTARQVTAHFRRAGRHRNGG